jgi:hypothetical protein
MGRNHMGIEKGKKSSRRLLKFVDELFDVLPLLAKSSHETEAAAKVKSHKNVTDSDHRQGNNSLCHKVRSNYLYSKSLGIGHLMLL